MTVIVTPPYFLKVNPRFPSLFLIASCRKTMVSTSSNKDPGTFITVTEKATFEKEIKRSKFIAIAGHISDEPSARSFLAQVRDPKATHNCWAYKIGDQFRSSDDGEPSGTAGKPICSSIFSSGIDRVMVVVIRYFGGIKLGTGGLVRAYGGITMDCLKSASTCEVKSKVPIGIEVPFDLFGVVYHQVRVACGIVLLSLRADQN
ncbi:IMPACT family member in pol 5'region isoform X2 [Telopea speciosissima]|uniref:IMPACT family member in pol 5'region isoform X2 n=1 Tax=Telopea speciosissima TaxID=54955 RepID=UPI001CC37FA6|nr:IMPACT family member in pol 5'region isoform X2 [Telopea speciosissima]